MDIIPDLKTATPNYWCSWLTQNEVSKLNYEDNGDKTIAFLGDQGAQKARNLLNENALFGEIGLAYQFPEVRKHLFFMLDDGWDVDYDIHPTNSISSFGSLSLSKERFPSCKGDDGERLKTLNDMIKKEGWRGLGIWVCAQKAGDDYDAPFENNEILYNYWKDRVLMSKKAGVTYWKVDWGVHAQNENFRKMLTDLGKEFFPELIIEHASCHLPINGDYKNGKFRFTDNEWGKDKFKAISSISDVFRSYDVTDPLSVTTTLDRVCYLLSLSTNSIINCEDELYMGAVLGCSVGVMRSKYANFKLDEVIATIRWQQIAPAFSKGTLIASEEIKYDEHVYQDNDTWYGEILGKKVTQGAPKIVARNLSLPTIKNNENSPYLLLSKNPNGAISIGAINSSSKKGLTETPPTVEVDLDNPTYIGVFGLFTKLTFNLNKQPQKVYIQSLIKGEAVQLNTNSCSLDINLELLKDLHLSTDGSQSAVIIKIEY